MTKHTTVVSMVDSSLSSSPQVLPGQRMQSSDDWRPALSASRAKEYMKCPLQYRLHVVDGLKEPPTRATARGTLVHSVLENLFDAQPSDRLPDYAKSLLPPLWEAMKESTPEVLSLFDSAQDMARWLDETYEYIDAYFALEDPRFLAPAAREAHIVVETPEGVRLRGFIDRIDEAPSGALRVVDYKTGKAPAPRFQEDALYQMRFYALLLDLSEKLPARTQLLYLKTGQVLTFDPESADIERFREQLGLLWESIENDARRGYFAARQNPLCNWCGVRQFCPIFDGLTPDLPSEGIEKLLRTRVGAS